MIIVFGFSQEREFIEHTDLQLCPHCKAERHFRATVTYQSFHLFFIPVVTSGRRYSLICDDCKIRSPLNTQDYEKKLGRNAVPWLMRFGWTIPFMIFGGGWLAIYLVIQFAKLFS